MRVLGISPFFFFFCRGCNKKKKQGRLLETGPAPLAGSDSICQAKIVRFMALSSWRAGAERHLEECSFAATCVTYNGRAGRAFVEGQAGGQDVVEPGEEASDLRRRNQQRQTVTWNRAATRHSSRGLL